MKPLIFEVPAVEGESVVAQDDRLPYFYNVFHKHEHIQITAILSGAGELVTRSGPIPFVPKQVFIIGSNQPHFFKSEEKYFKKGSKLKAHAIHLYFKSEMILANFNLPEFEEVKRLINRIGPGMKVDSQASAVFIDQVKHICKSRGTSRIFQLLELLRCCFFNLDQFSYLSNTDKDSDPYFYNNKTRINDIYAYTLAHFADDITLSSIARVANLTVPAMCKYFKKSTRKTYMEFLKEVRIDFACKKIIRGDYNTIAEIAYSVGFKSAITFNRAFKSQTGKTPTEYLAAHRNNIEKPQQLPTVDKYFVFH
ncbi:AraC family transcriptional regulator [Niabella terrae]